MAKRSYGVVPGITQILVVDLRLGCAAEDDLEQAPLRTISDHCATLGDPRLDRTKQHQLLDMMVRHLLISAVQSLVDPEQVVISLGEI